MKAWIIEGPTGVLIPATCGRTKSETIRSMIAWCDWYIFPDWKVLLKEGFRPVKCEINKTPSNAGHEATAVRPVASMNQLDGGKTEDV